MAVSRLGVAAIGVLLPVLVGLVACGTSSTNDGFPTGSSGAGSSGNGGGVDAGDDGLASSSDDSSAQGFGDGFAPQPDGSSGSPTATGSYTSSDCSGCKFPGANAPSCAASAPAIKIVYPIDGVLLPPNMSVLSVQWTPFGNYQSYEVDFSNSVTDVHIATKCATQTQDTSQPQPVNSGGCELVLLPPNTSLPNVAYTGIWDLLAAANRGGSPVMVTVRGTTNGVCATSSANTARISFAEEDLLGDIYYWKSLVVPNMGTGGQIWVKSFGDLNPEQQTTGPSTSVLPTWTCNGCHALSRDGMRMVVYSDDADSDDEYSDVYGSLVDMAAKATLGVAAGGGGGRGGRSGQPPGFSTLSPSHTLYVTSNGLNTSPTNTFGLWDGNAGTLASTITLGNANERPTMPDWSGDGASVVYVLPTKVANWSGGVGGNRNDDDHEFGGSLYTVPYMGNQKFGAPTLFIASKGENNYYPSYSPDGQFIIFDRAPQDTSVSAIDGCVSSPHPACPNDSFSNPAARLMLTPVTAAAPIDLERANGSAAKSPLPLSNSWPRWSPFVQTYRGNRLLWVAFSSTRDYGVRVRNHLPGMYQCYPPDSAEQPGAQHGQLFDAACQQPKLWMAAINLSEGQGGDPSFPAFYLPYQDIGTHNHTPQWTQQVVSRPPMDGGACIMQGGNCASNPSACCAPYFCTGNGTCGQVVQ